MQTPRTDLRHRRSALLRTPVHFDPKRTELLKGLLYAYTASLNYKKLLLPAVAVSTCLYATFGILGSPQTPDSSVPTDLKSFPKTEGGGFDRAGSQSQVSSYHKGFCCRCNIM